MLEDAEDSGAQMVQGLRRELAAIRLIVEDRIEAIRELASRRWVEHESAQLTEVLLERCVKGILRVSPAAPTLARPPSVPQVAEGDLLLSRERLQAVPDPLSLPLHVLREAASLVERPAALGTPWTYPAIGRITPFDQENALVFLHAPERGGHWATSARSVWALKGIPATLSPAATPAAEILP